MKYKDAFAIDSKTFKQRKEDNSPNNSKFLLNNFNYYEPKLINDFYLKYFIKKLLFEIDILELKDFLTYHYDYCSNPEKYYNILDFKVIPKIKEINEKAKASFGEGNGYFDEQKLEDGFVLAGGVIQKYDYDYRIMLNDAGWGGLQNEFKKRIEIINVFIGEYKNKTVVNSLKWIAGPSQLAIVIRELLDKGYLQANEINGEVNNAELARELFKIFAIECESSKSIEIYLSSGNKRNIAAKKKFENLGFCIPDAKFT
ncbi:hypothetical protein [Tenacibaculum piscium]|uniref:hypothetical protein n=1 Tax=Tenacibaculum piscium TaxID=1458515 RepID=UPI001EFBCB3B|nr:hypothetical protein [Tenacibaculum piscium]MCG8182765.1 hypothetical protein [Tenacibaculum piscium]MCG8204157.1 hypothetical protein [Tenacibaculum piscium]